MSLVTVVLSEWDRKGPEEDDRLIGYSFEGDQFARNQAKRLTESGRLEIRELREGLFIRSNSHVGTVQLASLRIVIQPKIRGTPLLNLLRYAYNLRKLDLYTLAEQAIGDSNFLDLLIHQLAAEVQELISRGLHRSYERTENVLASPRGRIDFQRYARQGGTAVAALPCIHHPRLQDTLINRVILSGLHVGNRLTDDLFLRTRLRRLARLMDAYVSPLKLARHTMAEVQRVSDRRTTAYEPALTLINMLLQVESVLLEDELAQVNLPGFLFDMNRFFQSLLLRFLRENLLGYEVQDEHSLRGMMAYSQNPRGWRTPAPRPDYMIRQGARVVGVLDAKYIDLWSHGPSSSILYQLSIYALSQGIGSEATILYPTITREAKVAVLVVRDPFFGTDQVRIRLRPVDLKYLEQLIGDSGSRLNERAQEAYAQYLVFGNSQPHTGLSD